MVHDVELTRQLLIELEKSQDYTTPKQINIDGRTKEAVTYHLDLLVQRGFIKADVNKTSKTMNVYPISLTASGHDFLEATRNETVWKRVLAKVAEKGGGISLAVLQTLVSEEARRFWHGP